MLDQFYDISIFALKMYWGKKTIKVFLNQKPWGNSTIKTLLKIEIQLSGPVTNRPTLRYVETPKRQ